MVVLVTGGAGFIGSHLVEALLADPEISQVRVLDNLSTGQLRNLDGRMDHIKFTSAGLDDNNAVTAAVDGVHVIFHEAAIPSVPRSVDNPLENHIHGAHATVQLLEAARKAGVNRVVFAASSSAYGNSEVSPKNEALLPSPLSPYAATKLACENYLAAYAQCYDLDTVALRYFNVYGPRQDPSSPYSGVISRFCTAFSTRTPPTVTGDGEQTRDFVFVRDIVRANLLAARCQQRLNGRAINIGTGVGTSVNAIISNLNDIVGAHLSATHLPPRVGDVRHSIADIGLAKSLLGYSARYSLREGLEETFAWYNSQR
jgi:UDP-glucose 4-epimerase